MPRFNEQITKNNKDIRNLATEIDGLINDSNFHVKGDDGEFTEESQKVQDKYRNLMGQKEALEAQNEALRENELSRRGAGSFAAATVAEATAERDEISEDQATAVTLAIRNVWGQTIINRANKMGGHGEHIRYLNSLSDGERSALQAHFNAPDAEPQTLLNIMTSAQAGAGAEMVPEEIASEVAVYARFHSVIRQRVANVMSRDTLRRFSVPRYDDRAKGGFRAVEGKAGTSAGRAGGADDAAFTTNGGANLTSGAPFIPERIVTDAIPLTVELLDSSVNDFVSLLSEALGERLGRAESEAFTTGLGGIVGMTAEAAGHTTTGKAGPDADANQVTIQQLVLAAQSLDPAYQTDAIMQVNPNTIKAFRAHLAMTGNANSFNQFTTVTEDGQQITMLGQFIEIVGNAFLAEIGAGAKFGVVSSRSRGYRVYDFMNAMLDVRVFEEFDDFNKGVSKIVARKHVAGNVTHAPGVVVLGNAA